MTDKSNSKEHEQHGRAFYRGQEIVNFTDWQGRFFSARTHAKTLEKYERLLRNGEYNKVREFEKEHNIPYTWLNGVISRLIGERRWNGLGRKLVGEFRDRGYSESWLQEAQDIKGKNGRDEYAGVQ